MAKDKTEDILNAEEKETVEGTQDTATQENASTEEAKNEENSTEQAAEENTEVQPDLTAEVAKLKDQHLRLFAEFENYKKRTSKERVELFSTANQELMSALLPVLDDFKRALKNIADDKEKEGIQLIHNKFETTLKTKGLRPMDSTIGQEFDAETMEAVTRIPAPSEDLKGKVVDEIESGYYLGSKILRFPKVVTGE